MFKRKVICAIAVLSILLTVTRMSTPAAATNYKSIGVKTGILTIYQYNATPTSSIANSDIVQLCCPS